MLPSIAIVAGTRPEAIKLLPVIEALKKDGNFSLHFIATGQHRALFDQAMKSGGPSPDIDLGLMQADQPVGEFLARAAGALREAIAALDPGLVIVQGDTTTAYAGALAAYRLGCPLAHVEAGLRTASIDSPFPEELFRRAISRLSTLHFAPTELARDMLVHEGVARSAVHVTGNTGIDHLFQVMARPRLTNTATRLLKITGGGPFALATVHRRGNRGAGMSALARGFAQVAQGCGLPIILPRHPAPGLQSLEDMLSEQEHIHVIPPLDPDSFVQLLARAALAMTDSGGVQEEAVTLGTPVVVLRDETERSEAVTAGRAMLAGNDPGAMLRTARIMLDQGRFPPSTIFGDGAAGIRIAHIIKSWFDR